MRAHIAACVQLRYDSPLARRRPTAEPLLEMTDAELAAHCDAVMAGLDSAPAPDWAAIAARLNEFLGPDWPAPPWSAAQVNTVAMVLSLAEDDGRC